MNKAHTIYLFTNRNAGVFDEHGQQIVEYQRAIDCYTLDPVVAQQAIDEASIFFLAKWGGWGHEISKKETEYLLGLRTFERDLAELDEQQRTG